MLFAQSFFVKSSKNFFSIKITNKICPRHSIFNFCNRKNFFRAIWNVIFSKNIFMFWYSKIKTNFTFRSFLIIFFIKVKIYAWLYTILLWYISLYLFTTSSNLSMYQFFDIEVMYLNFILLGSNRSSSNNRFSFVIYWIHFYCIFF